MDKTIQEIFEESKQILCNAGYEKHITVKNISLNNRLTKTKGRYFTNEERIEISTRYYQRCILRDVYRIVLHEITHNIQHNMYPNSFTYNGGHTKEWFEIADDVTNKTGYLIERCTIVTWRETA